ncbi:MAG TPA: phytanoyl-CoA dioxygenase family protein [Chitinophagales bacterium]|nr:phytanoyl-CoA dioxygenase family protein [Chitinophagales bacterium]
MLKQLLNKLKADNQMAWKPVKHAFIRNAYLAEKIHDAGFATAGMLDINRVRELQTLYSALHHFKKPQGGMFYSIYSRDIDYRKKVHKEIGNILKPVYDDLFHDYKCMLHSFIVKVSGPESEFSLHQDSTSLDETKYSCLSVWIPLQDTDVNNGCLCVVPHSHKMFSPYRSISIPSPFADIANTVRKYLLPIQLKTGEILLFDNRLVHNSVVNHSGTERVVVMSGIFPVEAKLLSCYKDAADKSSAIEVFEQDDEFLLTYPNFYHDCTCRPEAGRSMGFINWNTRQMSEQAFLSLCLRYGVKEVNHPAVMRTSNVQAIIGEPV